MHTGQWLKFVSAVSFALLIGLCVTFSVVKAEKLYQTVPTAPPPTRTPTLTPRITATPNPNPTNTPLLPTSTFPVGFTSIPPTQTAIVAATQTAVVITSTATSIVIATQSLPQGITQVPAITRGATLTIELSPTPDQPISQNAGNNLGSYALVAGVVVLVVLIFVGVWLAGRRNKGNT